MTNVVAHRYPNPTDAVRLAGAHVLIRPALRRDLELQREFFRSLSCQRRYMRFMTGFQELPEPLVELFASIDHRTHVGLLASVFDGPREIMIGEARYVLEPHNSTACELAVCVADDWSFKRLGSTLLERLEHLAMARGVRHMRAETLTCNTAMISLGRRAGYAMRMDEDPTIVQLEKTLPAFSTTMQAA